MLQRHFGPLVAVIGRFHLVENRLHIHRMLHILRDELRHVVFLRLDIDPEIEVRWVHPPDMQIGDVPHQPYRYRRIEIRQRHVIRRLQPVRRALPVRSRRSRPDSAPCARCSAAAQ